MKRKEKMSNLGKFKIDPRIKLNTTIAGDSYGWLAEEQERSGDAYGRIIDRLIEAQAMNERNEK